MKLLLEKKKTIISLCVLLVMGIMSLTPNIVVKAENGDDASDYTFDKAIPTDLFDKRTSYHDIREIESDNILLQTTLEYKCVFYYNDTYYMYNHVWRAEDDDRSSIVYLSDKSLKNLLDNEEFVASSENYINYEWVNSDSSKLDNVILYFFDENNNPLFTLPLKDIDDYVQDLIVHIKLTNYEYVYDSNKYIIGVKVEGTVDKDIDDFVAELYTREDDFELDTVTYDANTHTFSGICNINEDFELGIFVEFGEDAISRDFSRYFYFSNITSYNRQRELELNQGAEPPTTQPDDNNTGGGNTTTTPDNTGGNNTATPPTGNDGQTGGSDNQPSLPEVGTKKTVSNGVYQVIKSSATSKEVVFTKPQNSKKTSVTIPDTIKIDGQTYTVTEVAAKAFKNNKKIKTVTIGKNIKKIGKEAFSGCKKLNKIVIKGSGLKNVGKNAIKGINAKATIKCPKKQLEAYKKLFKSKTGYKKSMKIKK